MILILETGGQICTVALADLNGKMLALAEGDRVYAHAEQMPGLAAAVLKQAGADMTQLSAVAVNRGPGSYTGLRIGASFAKGLCYGLGIPLIAVDSLKVLAMEAAAAGIQAKKYICMIDARRDEVFMAVYDPAFNVLEKLHAYCLEPDSWAGEWFDIAICGDSGEKVRKLVHGAVHFKYFDAAPAAGMMCAEAARMMRDSETADLAYFEPDYGKEFMAGVTKRFAV